MMTACVRATTAQKEAILEAGLDYIAQGLSLIPIGDDKHPLVKWKKHQTQRATAEDLRNWSKKPRFCGIAVVLGDISGGLACRDFDAAVSYPAWAAAHPDLARTLPTAKTARGYHVYFTCFGLKTRTKKDGEVRGNIVYVLLPPSLHPSGITYEWLIPLGEVIPTIDPDVVGLSKEWAESEDGIQGCSGVGNQGNASRLLPTPSNDNCLPINPVDPNTLNPCFPVSHACAPLSQPADLPAELFVTGPHQHDPKSLGLARHLKFILKIDTPDAARPYFDHWFARGRAFMQEDNPDLAWMKFERALRDARIPPNSHPAEVAWARVLTEPLPPEAAQFTTNACQKLVALVYQMGRDAAGESFLLSAHQAAHFAGITPKNAHVALHGFCLRNFLCCVDRGRPGPPGRGASRWKWLGSRQAAQR